MSFDEARKELTSRFDSVTPEEFAYGEQQLKEDGVEDGEMQDRMDELLRLFDGILKRQRMRRVARRPSYQNFSGGK